MSGKYATIPHRVNYPWYQKPLSSRRYQCGVLSALDTSGWISVVPGLDDFRTGPPTSEKGTIRPVRRLGRGIRLTEDRSSYDEDQLGHKSTSSPLSSEFEKTSYLSIHRRERRSRDKMKDKQAEFEQRLQENPLVLLPYLESNLPHEVFEKLVAMIGAGGRGSQTEPPASQREEPDDDPNKQIPAFSREIRRESLMSSRKSISIMKRKQSEATVLLGRELSRSASRESQTEVASGGTPDLSKEGRPSTSSVVGDPYRAFLKRREYGSPQSQKRAKSARPLVARRSSESINVNKVAEDFCDWMRNVGGEDPKYNIEPDKVITLFAIDTETKPAVSTAIQVLDQANIPEELMVDKAAATSSAALRSSGKTIMSDFVDKPKRRARVPKEEGKPKFTHYRYGAWYLEVDSWKKLGKTEQLEDPEEVEKREAYEASLRSDEVDQQLSTLFSVRSLREYFRKTNIKLPHFLKNVPNPYESADAVASPPVATKKAGSSVRL